MLDHNTRPFTIIVYDSSSKNIFLAFKKKKIARSLEWFRLNLCKTRARKWRSNFRRCLFNEWPSSSFLSLGFLFPRRKEALNYTEKDPGQTTTTVRQIYETSSSFKLSFWHGLPPHPRYTLRAPSWRVNSRVVSIRGGGKNKKRWWYYIQHTHTHFTRDAEEKKNKWRREMMKQTISSGWGFFGIFCYEFHSNKQRGMCK